MNKQCCLNRAPPTQYYKKEDSNINKYIIFNTMNCNSHQITGTLLTYLILWIMTSSPSSLLDIGRTEQNRTKPPHKTMKVSEKISSFICTVLALVLIVLELRTFFVVKPTSTEQTTTALTFRLAPQIIFCPQPAFPLETINLLGYEGTVKI